jgi:hypothetical protein
MSYGQVLDDRTVTGRKPHWCLHCGRIIAKGERHRAVKVVGDDGIETQRECVQCETLAGVIYAHDPDLRYEEFWDLGEYVIECAPNTDLDAAWRLRWAAVAADEVRALAVACFPAVERSR